MVERIVAAALAARPWVMLLAVALLVAGLAAYVRLDIEAYPNPVPPMVEIIAQPEGWGSEEVERYVTIPLEVGLAGLPGLRHMRSQSLFGLSDIKIYFEWSTNYWNARQEVINRLQFVDLPVGVKAQLSPWNAIGELYRYTLEGKGYSLDELKTAQNWILERQFARVPGVVDVTSFGGETRQYHVEVNPHRLRGHGVSLTQVTDAIANANKNAGGQRLTLGEQSYDIRGIGLIGGINDIALIVIAEQNGMPVRVRDVAEVNIGPAPRLGIVGQNDQPDVVQGIVLMRYGAETPATLKGIHERVDYIHKNRLLPPGMVIRPFYDRGELVEMTTHVVIENMLVGVALVLLVLYAFLGNLRAALITALNIPLALMVAFIGLVTAGTSANLISIGAVDFGIVVDSTVIMMENLFHHLGRQGRGDINARLQKTAAEVGRPMAYATLIIAATFLPLFTMQGVAGVIFAPMARTYAMAIGGAVILALTVTPVLASLFIAPDLEEKENAMMRLLHRIYDPLFDLALRWPRAATAVRLVPILLCFFLFPLLGREFMPKLEEGNLWIRATLPMSISMEQSARYVGRMRNILRGCPDDPKLACTDENRRHPEVKLVQSQLGRPDDGTDVSGFFNLEFFCPLMPLNQFPAGLTKARLVEMLDAELSHAFPSVVFAFSQMISDNAQEGVAGVKGENSVKVFGPSLEQNEAIADSIVETMASIRGVEDLGLLRSLGQPTVKITPDRSACARYGLNTGDVVAVIEAAIGGIAVTQVFEGEKRFDLTVRWQPQFRQSLDAIRHVTIDTPHGTPIPLGQVAKVETVEGPATVYREDGQRYAPIKFSVRGRDLASTVSAVQNTIAERVRLPYDARLEWSGEMNELRTVQERLSFMVPLSLLLVALLAYSAVRNWLDTLIVLIDIPVACTGGILALLITGEHFSVSAAMGFISIFGVAIQDAILVVTYFQRLYLDEGVALVPAARQAAEKRFRPVLMTTLVATLGLLPAAVSTGIGAQTQRPLAIVVIGGSLMVALLTRVLQPTLLVMAHSWRGTRPGEAAATGRGP